MDKTLYLEKRGCDFFDDDTSVSFSDVGNYRVCTPSECIKGKDGRTFFLEFTSGAHRRTRYTNKITGKPLKHPKQDVIIERGIFLDTQYSVPTENGYSMSYRDCKIERNVFEKHLPYTLENILAITNEISEDNYTNIVFV